MIVNPSIITRIRQNHALEHATITILAKRSETPLALAGRATPSGFYIYGDVSTTPLYEAVKEGLTRLQKGETDLAISPFCGTNVAVAGTLAGISALVAAGKENRLKSLSRAILAATMAIMIAQPLGKGVQRYFTTSADVNDVHIDGITRRGKGKGTRHLVRTSQG
jgi:hypothetical protein